MVIHREGYRILIILFILLVLINLALFSVHHGTGWFFYGLLASSIIFYLLVVYFFRKPKRNFTPDDNKIFSPADGTVVAIEEVMEDLYYHEKRLQVSIFMSPLNVHVNYYPISGIVDYVNHEQGFHWVAWHPKSSKENERTSIVIKHKNGNDIMVRQIAGAVARRIVTYSKVEKAVKQGDQLGFIKFGSRVDVFLPLNTNLNIKLDDKVKGNNTILADFK